MADTIQSGGVVMEKVGEDLLLVDAYGDNGFRIGGSRVEGSLLITADGFYPVQATSLADLTEADFEAVLGENGKPEILFVGTGAKMQLLPGAIRKYLKANGLSPEVMDTGAAARTFNVLRMEDRRIAALLLQVE